MLVDVRGILVAVVQVVSTNIEDFSRDHPPLNKNKQSLPFELFDS